LISSNLVWIRGGECVAYYC